MISSAWPVVGSTRNIFEVPELPMIKVFPSGVATMPLAKAPIRLSPTPNSPVRGICVAASSLLGILPFFDSVNSWLSEISEVDSILGDGDVVDYRLKLRRHLILH